MDVYRNYGDKMDFHVHDQSSFEEVGEAVLVCAFAATGYGNTTEAQQADAHELGPKLLEYANERFGPDSSLKISTAIAVTAIVVKAALKSRQGASKDATRGLMDEVFGAGLDL